MNAPPCVLLPKSEIWVSALTLPSPSLPMSCNHQVPVILCPSHTERLGLCLNTQHSALKKKVTSFLCSPYFGSGEEICSVLSTRPGCESTWSSQGRKEGRLAQSRSVLCGHPERTVSMEPRRVMAVQLGRNGGTWTCPFSPFHSPVSYLRA